MAEITLVSVVRDYSMYLQCIKNNPYTKGVNLVAFDNREKNESISVLYNRFLDDYDYGTPSWFLFCHEDLMPNCDISSALQSLPHDAIWGPIGAKTDEPKFGYCKWHGLGKVLISNKDGSSMVAVGEPVSTGTPVETLDCCCMIVHSSLVERYGMRFDEKLSFDLYVEDFCITAQERFGIAIKICDFLCHHFSKAYPGKRYREQHTYLNKKWKDVSYSAPCSWQIGGKHEYRWINACIKECIIQIMRKLH